MTVFTDGHGEMMQFIRKMTVFTDGHGEMKRFIRKMTVFTDAKARVYDEETD